MIKKSSDLLSKDCDCVTQSQSLDQCVAYLLLLGIQFGVESKVFTSYTFNHDIIVYVHCVPIYTVVQCYCQFKILNTGLLCETCHTPSPKPGTLAMLTGPQKTTKPQGGGSVN